MRDGTLFHAVKLKVSFKIVRDPRKSKKDLQDGVLVHNILL